MSSLPATPASQVAAQPIPAATINSHRDNLNFLLNPPRWRLLCTTAFSVPTGGGSPTLDTEVATDGDTDGVHTGTNGFVTIVTPGLYVLRWAFTFAGSTAGTQLATWLVVNSVAAAQTEFRLPAIPTNAQPLTVAGFVAERFAVGDVVAPLAFQDTGGALALTQTGTSANFFEGMFRAA